MWKTTVVLILIVTFTLFPFCLVPEGNIITADNESLTHGEKSYLYYTSETSFYIALITPNLHLNCSF